MNNEGSVTQWIQELANGEQSLAQAKLFDRYFAKLVSLARGRVNHAPRAAEDEEDVAISAMESFFQRANHGAFSELSDRCQLWALLVTITTRKSINQFKRLTARRRQVPGKGLLNDASNGVSLEEIVGGEPTPELAAGLAEEFNRRIDSLGDSMLRRIAIMKLEGYNNQEIATELNVAVRTIGRKLYLIRREWAAEIRT